MEEAQAYVRHSHGRSAAFTSDRLQNLSNGQSERTAQVEKRKTTLWQAN